MDKEQLFDELAIVMVQLEDIRAYIRKYFNGSEYYHYKRTKFNKILEGYEHRKREIIRELRDNGQTMNWVLYGYNETRYNNNELLKKFKNEISENIRFLPLLKDLDYIEIYTYPQYVEEIRKHFYNLFYVELGKEELVAEDLIQIPEVKDVKTPQQRIEERNLTVPNVLKEEIEETIKIYDRRIDQLKESIKNLEQLKEEELLRNFEK